MLKKKDYYIKRFILSLAAGTGVTVFRLTVPGRAAVAVFGGGLASRETEAIAPERNHPLNAIAGMLTPDRSAFADSYATLLHESRYRQAP